MGSMEKLIFSAPQQLIEPSSATWDQQLGGQGVSVEFPLHIAAAKPRMQQVTNHMCARTFTYQPISTG